MLWAFIISRGWPGTSWTIFILLIFAALTYTMFPFFAPELLAPRHMPREFRAACPMEIIQGVMDDIATEGYDVVLVQDRVTNPEMREQVLITYEVSEFDGSESWTYTWGWQGPYDIMSGPSREEVRGLIYKMELKPKTDEARAVQDVLNEALRADGFYFYVWE